MIRFLGRVFLRLALLLAVIAVLIAVLGPFLIDTNPAPGISDPRSVAPASSDFIALPRDHGESIDLHYLARVGPEHTVASDQVEPNPEPLVFVLLHGFTFNAFTWNALLDYFSGHGIAVAYDQIPYGLSDKPVPEGDNQRELYSRAAALERLFDFLDALSLDTVVLVGNSSGGTLALEAASSRPERIAALILISPWVQSKRPILPAWLAELPQMQRLTIALARYLGQNSPLLDYSYADPAHIDDERRALTGAHRLTTGWDLAWGALLNRSLTDPVDIASRLDRIKQPVLVLSGDADQVVPFSDTEATASALPNATLVKLPGCGHVAQEECAEEVAEIVNDWLHTQDLFAAP